MKTVYRISLTASFDTTEDRDKAYAALKLFMQNIASKAAIFDRADMAYDQYDMPEPVVQERVV